MAYIIQATTMLCDLIFFLTLGFFVFYFMADFPANLVVFLLTFLVVRKWYRDGGFMAWNPKIIRMFFAEMRKMGF